MHQDLSVTVIGIQEVMPEVKVEEIEVHRQEDHTDRRHQEDEKIHLERKIVIEMIEEEIVITMTEEGLEVPLTVIENVKEIEIRKLPKTTDLMTVRNVMRKMTEIKGQMVKIERVCSLPNLRTSTDNV